jgi:hypothetical protein
MPQRPPSQVERKRGGENIAASSGAMPRDAPVTTGSRRDEASMLSAFPPLAPAEPLTSSHVSDSPVADGRSGPGDAATRRLVDHPLRTMRGSGPRS